VSGTVVDGAPPPRVRGWEGSAVEHGHDRKRLFLKDVVSRHVLASASTH